MFRRFARQIRSTWPQNMAVPMGMTVGVVGKHWCHCDDSVKARVNLSITRSVEAVIAAEKKAEEFVHEEIELAKDIEKKAEAFVHEEVEHIKECAIEIEKEVEEFVGERIVHPLRDTLVRFAPYVNYLAYTSDVGESFRLILPAFAVNATYGVAGTYCLGDVVYNGYLEMQQGSEVDTVMLTVVHSTLFQAIASLGFPYLIIHTAVSKSNKFVFRKASSVFLRNWGASILALCIIPFLPMVDEPVEQALDWLFEHMVPHAAHNARLDEEMKRKSSLVEDLEKDLDALFDH